MAPQLTWTHCKQCGRSVELCWPYAHCLLCLQSRDEEYIEELILQESMNQHKAREAAAREEKQDQLDKRRNKEALIDELVS